MILVTGTSGKRGQEFMAALAHAGAPTRALVRAPSQFEELTNLGAIEVMTVDFGLAANLPAPCLRSYEFGVLQSRQQVRHTVERGLMRLAIRRETNSPVMEL